MDLQRIYVRELFARHDGTAQDPRLLALSFLFALFFFFTFFIRSAAYAFEYVFVVFLVRPSGVHESGFDGRRIDAHAFWNEARQALISFLFFPRRILKSIWRKASVFLNGGVGLKKKKK